MTSRRPKRRRLIRAPVTDLAGAVVSVASQIAMAIPDTDLHRIRTWADNHTPPEARAHVWVELDITATAITVYECRPYWRPEEHQPPTRLPVARCRWNNTTKQWTLYWRDRNLRFRVWPRLEPQRTIVPLLAEIDDHANGAFWG